MADKFGEAGLSTQPSVQVAAPRVRECQVQLQAQVADIGPLGTQDPRLPSASCRVELRLLRAHVDETLDPRSERIDAAICLPLMMKFLGLHSGDREALPSRLAQRSEERYAPWKAGRKA